MAGIDRSDFQNLLTELRKISKSSERTAKANEDLIRLATEERETSVEASPPFCPHCGYFNPTIHSAGGQGEGELVNFLLPVTCGACNKPFFAIPEGWICLGNKDEVRGYFNARGGNEDDKRP